MVYCHKCGKKSSDNERFCSSCGNEFGKINVKDNKKWLFIGGGIILVLILIFIFTNGVKTGFSINNEKEECPHECCLTDNYQEKPCSQDYECKGNQCVAIDSDNDGLSDIEEKQISTNPQLFDSDGDTLSDYKEVKELNTNPLNVNTDNDRYNDNLDKEPLLTNSAKLNIEITSQDWGWKYANIILSIMGGVVISPNLIIAEPTATILVKNIGDDYTSYVTYDILFKVSGVLVGTKNIRLDKINPSQENTQIYVKPILAGDLPNLVINAVSKQTTDWTIEISNVNYENFN